MRISDCPACMKHYMYNPMLVEACASVGLSNGKSTKEMLVAYMRRYHRDGHPKDPAGEVEVR